MKHVAESTIALSVFNAMAAMDKSCTTNEIKAFLATHWSLLDDEELASAVDELVKRGHAKRDGDLVVPLYPDPPTRPTKMIMMRPQSEDGWF